MFIVRKYEAKDRATVRAIACKTALMGDPSAIFFDDDEIFADALTLYFTDHESGSCFVVEHENNVVGYLLGAKDVFRMEKVSSEKIVGPLLWKALQRGTLLRLKNLRFFVHVFLSCLKGEFKAPSFSADYPAILHINFMEEYRGQGLGSKLIQTYLDHLRTLSVKGVHLSTLSEQAGQFYKKQGFQRLFKSKRSYFRYFLGRDVENCIYGMCLSK